MSIFASETHELLIDVALFAGPVVMLGIALLVAAWRDRRRQAAAKRARTAAGSSAGLASS